MESATDSGTVSSTSTRDTSIPRKDTILVDPLEYHALVPPRSTSTAETDPTTSFKHIQVPSNFFIYDETDPPDVDEVRRSIQNLRESFGARIEALMTSEANRPGEDTLSEEPGIIVSDRPQSSTTPSSRIERRDPSKSIERRRAALAALRLRYDRKKN